MNKHLLENPPLKLLKNGTKKRVTFDHSTASLLNIIGTFKWDKSPLRMFAAEFFALTDLRAILDNLRLPSA